MMDVICLFTSAAGILVAVGAIGLHVENKRRFEKLETALRRQENEISTNKNKIRILEGHDMDRENHIYIVHTPDDSDVRYPSQEGLS